LPQNIEFAKLRNQSHSHMQAKNGEQFNQK